MIDEKVLIERLLLESAGCKVYKLINPNIEDVKEFNAYKKCIEIVNQLAEEHGKDTNVLGNNGWIPCSERLPEDVKTVFVTCIATDGTPYTAFARCKRNRWSYYPSNIEIKYAEVIAWQPLPAPYVSKDK